MEYRCRPFLYRQERRVGKPAAHGGGNIAALLGGDTTADTVYEVLTAKNSSGEPYQYRMLAKGVDKPVADSILNYADEYRMDPEDRAATGKRILYFSTEQATTRSYPYGEFLSSVLGFCNSDGEGAYGLENTTMKPWQARRAAVWPRRMSTETPLPPARLMCTRLSTATT